MGGGGWRWLGVGLEVAWRWRGGGVEVAWGGWRWVEVGGGGLRWVEGGGGVGMPSSSHRFYMYFVFSLVQADRRFATSRLRSDEDGTILAHNYSTRFGLVHRKRGERSAGSG